MTVLKQEIPSPFESDQVKKIVKTSILNKEQVHEISEIDQVTTNAAEINKNGNMANGNAGNANASVTGNTAAAAAACPLIGSSNSNSSTSNELANCLENVAAQHQVNSNEQNDERIESNSLRMWFLDLFSFRYVTFPK